MRLPLPSRRIAAIALAVAVAAAILMTALVVRANAAQYVGTKNNAEAYFKFRNSTSDGWDPLKTPEHWQSTKKNSSSGNVAYCLEHRVDFPLGGEAYKSFDPSSLYNSKTRIGLQAIMQRGYPASTGGLNASEARYATANAVRAWIYERGGGGYSFMDFRGYDPGRSSTWKLVQPNSGHTDVFKFTLALLQAARDQRPLNPTVTITAPTMRLVNGVYTGVARVDLNDCNSGYRIRTRSSGLSISGSTGKDGDVLTLTVPRAYAGQTLSLVLEGMDTRTPANLYWYAPSAGSLQHFVVADYSVKNTAAQGRLDFALPTGVARIRKVDAEDGTPLAGATFRIYQGGILMDSPVSGADGYAVSTLPAGTYTVNEIVPPKGYNVDPTPQTVTISPGRTTDITMSNERSVGHVFIHKISSERDSVFPPSLPPVALESVAMMRALADGAPGLAQAGLEASSSWVATETDLPGAVFVLSRPVPVSFVASLRSRTLMVGGPDGVLSMDLNSIAPGDEITVTVEPAERARLDGTALTGVTPGDGTLLLTTTATGLTASIPFTVLSNSIGPGITELTWLSGPSIETSVGLVSTSTLHFAPGQPLYVPSAPGTVSVEATWNAPGLSFGAWSDGATETLRAVGLADLPLQFTMLLASVDASGNTTEDTATLGVPVGTQIPLPPVTTVYASDSGIYDEDIETMTTGPEGTVTSVAHDPGTYSLREVAAPRGYELDPTVHEFYLAAGETAQFEIADRPRRGTLHVLKADAVTGSLLAGAEFRIDDAAGSSVTTITSGAEGSAIATGLVPGDYTLTETKAPVGWQLSDQVATFTIDPLSEDATVTLTFEDEPLERIAIEKRNALGEHELLQGAVFELHFADDDSVVATLTTGEDGRAESELLPLGDYYAVETSAPVGFELDPERRYVTLDGGGGVTVTIQATDTPIPPDWGGVVVFFRHVWDNTEIAKSEGFDAPAGTDFMPWVRAGGFEGKKIADYVYTGRQDVPIPGPTAGGYDTPPTARLYTNAPGNALDANGQPITVETKPGAVYGQPDPATPEIADGTTYKPFGVLGTYTDVAYVGKAPASNRLIAGKLVLTFWYKRVLTGEWKNIGVAPKTGDWRSGKIPSADLAKTGTLSREEMARRLDAAKKRNPEVVGYINIPGTGIHYPVVQGPDNTKYLTKDATGAKSGNGAIFADVRCSPYVKGDAAARSTILYGHNMKDGSMFGRIDDYGSSSSFYKAHPLIQYVDAAGNGGLWRVYSVRKSTTADSVYTYPVTAPYARRVASWSAQSVVDAGFKPKTDGWSLTLSTCTYDRADGTGRILVQGELLEGYSNGHAGD